MTKFDYEQQFSVEWSVHEHIDILSPIEINPLHSRSIYIYIYIVQLRIEKKANGIQQPRHREKQQQHRIDSFNL